MKLDHYSARSLRSLAEWCAPPNETRGKRRAARDHGGICVPQMHAPNCETQLSPYRRPSFPFLTQYAVHHSVVRKRLKCNSPVQSLPKKLSCDSPGQKSVWSVKSVWPKPKFAAGEPRRNANIAIRHRHIRWGADAHTHCVIPRQFLSKIKLARQVWSPWETSRWFWILMWRSSMEFKQRKSIKRLRTIHGNFPRDIYFSLITKKLYV